MGQLKYSLAILSGLMYRDFSLFISYKHLYITNILYTLIYFRCLFIVSASALSSLIFIYLFSDVFIVMLSYILFPNGTSHRVDVLTQDRCAGIPHSNLLYHSYFPTRRYSIEAFIWMVAPHRPYSSSWSTTFLVNELGQGEYRGGALQLVSEPYSEQM